MTISNPTPTTSPAGALATPARAWWGLAALALPVLLVSVDASVLYLALPTISEHLNPSAAQQLWILDIYGFLIAGLLIPMGNLGDRIGRKRLLLIGTAGFGIASLIAALSESTELLIFARAIQGVAGATLLPSSLSLISAMFPNSHDRAKAIGIWTAVFAAGGAMGPIIGGALLEHFWWGSVFLVNVPVVVTMLIVGGAILPEYKSPAQGPFDLISIGLSLFGILSVTYALKTIATHGLDTIAVIMGVVGTGVIVLFIRRQRVARHPLVDLNLFANPQFSVAISASLIGMMVMAGTSFLSSSYLQMVLGKGAMFVGLINIPMALTVATSSVRYRSIVKRIGVRYTFASALTLSAVGSLMILFTTADSGVPIYIAASILAGAGYGTSFALVSEVVVSASTPERAGAATSLSETSFELGSALGLAVLGSVSAMVFRSATKHSAVPLSTINDAVSRYGSHSPESMIARHAFVDGMHTAMICGGLLLTMAAVVVALFLRRIDGRRHAHIQEVTHAR